MITLSGQEKQWLARADERLRRNRSKMGQTLTIAHDGQLTYTTEIA